MPGPSWCFADLPPCRVAALEIEPYLSYVISGAIAGGWHNRMATSGRWDDSRGDDDAHGRALWGLGEALAAGRREERVIEAMRAGILSFDTTHPRAVAFAMLGVVATIEAGILTDLASDFLLKYAPRIPRPAPGTWKWPEGRLTYSNARMAEALIRAGATMGDSSITADGLDLLEWLIEEETNGDVFSFTPVGGRGPGESKPGFDQQPVEAWSMADACFAARAHDDNREWDVALQKAAEWLLGRNDCGFRLYDPSTGAGFDGLGNGYVNQNRGAESTLSALGALTRLAQTESDPAAQR